MINHIHLEIYTRKMRGRILIFAREGFEVYSQNATGNNALQPVNSRHGKRSSHLTHLRIYAHHPVRWNSNHGMFRSHRHWDPENHPTHRHRGHNRPRKPQHPLTSVPTTHRGRLHNHQRAALRNAHHQGFFNSSNRAAHLSQYPQYLVPAKARSLTGSICGAHPCRLELQGRDSRAHARGQRLYRHPKPVPSPPTPTKRLQQPHRLPAGPTRTLGGCSNRVGGPSARHSFLDDPLICKRIFSLSRNLPH